MKKYNTINGLPKEVNQVIWTIIFMWLFFSIGEILGFIRVVSG